MSAENHRSIAMKKATSIKTWANCWPVWEKEIRSRTNDLQDARKILALGDSLREVFFSTNTGTRDQGSLSGGGAGWECLVTWYLNLVLSGTNAVAMKQAKYVIPQTLLDATTISYGTNQTNTESDVCVVVYPQDFSFPPSTKSYMSALDAEVAKRISDIELGVIQCKTNWNDNAQIPMLWDMVYRAQFGPKTSIHIGKKGYNISNLNRFTYAFATVPSQKAKNIPSKSSQMAVKRVSSLSGGNYWGLPTNPGVALSLSEIFDRNFASAFHPNIIASIQNAIDKKLGLFE